MLLRSRFSPELYCAAKELPGSDLKPYFGSDDKWIALIDMYLQASIEANASPAMSLLGPFNLAKAAPVGGSIGIFSAAIGGSFDETRTKLQEYKIYVNLQQLLSGTIGPGADGKKVDTGPSWAQFTKITVGRFGVRIQMRAAPICRANSA